jgi:hypothetical protein
MDVIDRSYHKETGELQQFTLIDDSGQPQLVKATPENILLYDPEDQLPFDDGMQGLLAGDEAIKFSDEPDVIVSQTGNNKCFLIRVDERTVETTPSQSEDALEAIKQATLDGAVEGLISLHETILAKQVRRSLVSALMQTFDEPERLTHTDEGWLVDDFYLVNWEASLYTKHNDPDENDYRRGSGGVTETDGSYEFVQLRLNREMNPVSVTVAGEEYQLTEREMLFLAKVKWLLGRRSFHPDMSFWKWTDQYASVEQATGDPITDDESDSSEFDGPML